MRVLFLDDMSSRWITFYNRMKAPGVVLLHAWTADEAIGMLKEDTEGYDYVFLDHDLDPGAYEGTPQEKTGMDVVHYIVHNATAFPRTKFIVHSLNHPARERMCAALRDAGLTAVSSPGAWEKVVRVANDER